MSWVDQLHSILRIPGSPTNTGGYAPPVWNASITPVPEPTKGFTPSWQMPPIVGQRAVPAAQPTPTPPDVTRQAASGATNIPKTSGPDKTAVLSPNNAFINRTGLADRNVPPNYSQLVRAQGQFANPAQDTAPWVNQQTLTPQPVTPVAVTPAIQSTPEYTSNPAGMVEPPQTWMQKLTSPEGRDFIAMIGQMLASKGTSYGNEPPAALGFANAARGVTQQDLANDWSTRLAADPNATPPSTLSPEAQKQVMDIHEHKAVNEERKYRRQMELQQLELQKQHLDAQARKDEADLKFNEEKLKIDKMLADQKITESQADSLLNAARIRSMAVGDETERARQALLAAQTKTEQTVGGAGGGLTPAQDALQKRSIASARLDLAKYGYSKDEIDQMIADAYGEEYAPAAGTAAPAQKVQTGNTAETHQATVADIQKLLKLYPNDPKLIQALQMLQSGQVSFIPIKAGSTLYNALTGGK